MFFFEDTSFSIFQRTYSIPEGHYAHRKVYINRRFNVNIYEKESIRLIAYGFLFPNVFRFDEINFS